MTPHTNLRLYEVHLHQCIYRLLELYLDSSQLYRAEPDLSPDNRVDPSQTFLDL